MKKIFTILLIANTFFNSIAQTKDEAKGHQGLLMQELCVVTADSATGSYNVVVWEKPAITTSIDSFYIYRQEFSVPFQKIAAVHRDSLSVYNDYTADADSISYRYKIKVLDNVGILGDFGLYHSSIHLEDTGNGQFQWSFYEIEGLTNVVASYNFYRDDSSSGNFNLLQIVPGTLNTFTDSDYASYPNASYRVDVNWLGGNTCSPSRATVNTTRSNIKHNSRSMSIDEKSISTFTIYPNPAKDHLMIQFPKEMNNVRILIQNMLGQNVLFQEGLSTDNSSCRINVSALPKGAYVICVSDGKSRGFSKLIIE
jgi:hypothetical protein